MLNSYLLSDIDKRLDMFLCMDQQIKFGVSFNQIFDAHDKLYSISEIDGCDVFSRIFNGVKTGFICVKNDPFKISLCVEQHTDYIFLNCVSIDELIQSFISGLKGSGVNEVWVVKYQSSLGVRCLGKDKPFIEFALQHIEAKQMPILH